MNKKKIILSFLGSLGFVVVSFWMISVSGDEGLRNVVSLLWLWAASLAGILFFGMTGSYFAVKLFDSKPGLIINNEGIVDNATFAGVGLVKWENITGMEMFEIHGHKILTVNVNNAGEIMARQTGFKKFVIQQNWRFFRSPVHISAGALRCNFEELYKMLNEQLVLRGIIK